VIFALMKIRGIGRGIRGCMREGWHSGRSAMQRRRWAAETKAAIVLEGLKGKPVSDICTEHQISQSLYYQWRDEFLTNAAKAFERHQRTGKEGHLEQENAKLKKLVAELILQLRKRTRG
jgi:transposase-like protein